MYVSSIEISNLRSIEKAAVRFQYPGSAEGNGNPAASPNVTLLLGDNGTGKTTILKAVALAVLSPVISDSGFRGYYLVRRTSGERTPARSARIRSKVVLHGQDLPPLAPFLETVESRDAAVEIAVRGDYERVEIKPKSGTLASLDTLYLDDSPAFLMIGYSATRRTEAAEDLDRHSKKSRGARYRRVAGLFEHHVNLLPLAASLALLSDSPRLDDLYVLLNDLLPDDIRFSGDFEELEPIFVHRGVSLPFPALSDGYRAYIGLLCDLLYHVASVCPEERDFREMSGVVLVDDIDLHLHPSWQRTVVTKLAKTLPRLQFIVTSHSPLVAGNLYAENIRVVSHDAAGAVATVAQLEEPIHGLNADQVLTSSYFNLTTTRSPDAVKQLEVLASQAASRTNPQAAVDFLKRISGNQ